jgi:PTH1 family peptidyl-tRNA hydrolase
MIIFGLGNPGPRYRLTRHNAGRLFLEQFARYYKKRFVRKSSYTVSIIKIKGHELLLIKPICYMNMCGVPIRKIIRRYNKEFMIILDDIDIPVGRMRLRNRGGDGGHLGLRSVIETLATDAFPRLRVGIGQRQAKRVRMDAADYVLESFTRTEINILRRVIEEGIKGIQFMVTESFAKAQNHINSIKIGLDSNG